MTQPRLNNRFVGLDRLLRASHVATQSLKEQEFQKRFSDQEALLARCKRLLDRLEGASVEMVRLRNDLGHHLNESSAIETQTPKETNLRVRTQHLLPASDIKPRT
jgi:hypothetical protein